MRKINTQEINTLLDNNSYTALDYLYRCVDYRCIYCIKIHTPL